MIKYLETGHIMEETKMNKPELLKGKADYLIFEKGKLIEDIKSAVEWTEEGHINIKNNVLKQINPKKKEIEYLGMIIDIVSRQWIIRIEKAFEDVIEEKGD